MLPNEAFAGSVAFLRRFDLNTLAVTNALCSTIAVKASAKIRWETFPSLSILVADEWMQIVRRIEEPTCQFVTNICFPSESKTTEFIAAAFPNCIFEDLTLFRTSKYLLDVIGRVADSIVVKGAICPPY